ncbi:bb16fb06-3785-4d2e-947b-09b4e887f362 [Thermothielavioides terrestris]|uniref:Bb16fb06-3785-4d2e-947b-09b4e887f362 n=1 Tax=Thermothielavioides terrestris TaxID=2587410 RepID=A0A3S4AMZ4_9PEZI|nr:bb16fb06-3785-4d2e-947b-09b4e887f362 [Thermothielavioides terrestris]
MSSTITTTSTYNTTTRHTLSRRPGRGGIVTASTPNLNQLYTAQSAQSAQSSRLAAPALARKGSVAALTQNSLAAIPDDSDSYAYNSVLTSDTMPTPLTPARPGGSDEIAIGDTVEVPGSMTGTVRFIGPVAGRKGTFAGVELHPDYAPRGKNSGDVDGVHYFTTAQPGAGIFLPLSKAIKREPPEIPPSSIPLTPGSGGLKVASQNATNYTPPTPGLPKLSQSVGAGRAPSPLGKKMRPSLPRPESPVRRLMTPGPRPTIATPAPKAPARFGSPTSANKFAQSVRGTAGDPSKRTPGHARKGSVGPRSVSALGVTSNPNLTDDDTTPVGVQRTQTNGSVGSVSSFALKVRPVSRATSRVGNHATDEEVERLRAELEERDRQLKEQATTLAEMENSLTELQGLIENSEGPPGKRRGSIDDKDATQLRALLREKNDKIAMLTAEFDAHRADFRSTIDTLEMASAETERVYEKRIEELMQEIQELQDRTADVDNIAAQLKQLEELVQELEEGLEDARRGEAEARGEVEFLRGEVERTRAELRREREKAQSAVSSANGLANGGSMSKELEQKEDEIRGLKAIIHSLSRDSVPNDNSDRTLSQRASSSRPHLGESIEDRLTREKLDREVAELRALLESKTSREEELERELETLRRASVMTAVGPGRRASAMTTGSTGNDRGSIRDSRGTVIAPAGAGSPESQQQQYKGLAPLKPRLPNRGRALETTPESDSYSTATENSTLWCEICETSGHDILTCTNVFGSSDQQQRDAAAGKSHGHADESDRGFHDPGIKPAPLSPLKPAGTANVSHAAPPTANRYNNNNNSSSGGVGSNSNNTPVRIIPNPMDSGPVAGKESGTVDASKWCALCERDGHDSVDCPFEDAF